MKNSEISFSKVTYHSSHGDPDNIPENPTMPQIAFCGRSNSGKSSLINAICSNNKLVKVSSQPGKTKEINFFLADDHYFLVDLPGFGYAKASHELRDTMIDRVNRYLNNSKTLRLIFILCDSKRALPEEEKNLVKIALKKKIRPVIVRTKIDKLNQKEKNILISETNSIQSRFRDVKVIHSSVKNSSGLNEILSLIKEY